MFILNRKGKLLVAETPLVMGICEPDSPDSFYRIAGLLPITF